MAVIQIEAVMDSLRKRRPIFHSEADLQHAFAWEVRTIYPDAHPRLEINIAQKQRHERLDVLIRHELTNIAIELKYKTRETSTSHEGEEFRLLNHSAQDVGRYDFIKDILRLEYLVHEGHCHSGYAILVTNDPGYWNLQRKVDSNHAQFSLSEGRTLEGRLLWGSKTGAGTMLGRESPLVLSGSYPMNWQEYSSVEGLKPLRFRYVIVPVEKSASNVTG